MTIIYIDGKQYNVNKSKNLLQNCLSLGLNIPYFCWHPALGSIGACRQCAVKQYNNSNYTSGHIVMSCMTPVSNENYFSINDNEVKKFRANIIELLMTNHPHDCPVCEEAGNCHLQDMTVMTGHITRRYRFTKRTHFNQNLGPFIKHEMNRCISCYRCIRYYRDYTDGTDLGVYGIHNNIYFGRVENGTLESEFSGNLIEICPTGVFTDKTHSKYYNRKWDMQFAPSICQQCSIGCNISPGERYGKLRKIENRYNGEINHYFLCDRGQFGYDYVNSKDRPRQAQFVKENKINIISTIEAIKKSTKFLKKSKKIIGIGSPRTSIENNYALRELVNEKNFYSGISTIEQNNLKLIINILQNGGIYTPTLREIENYDTILILGEDLTQTGARVALSVRQAVKGKAKIIAKDYKIADWQNSAILNINQNIKNKLFITNVDSSRLDDIATLSYKAPVDNQARFGFAIAHALNNSAPAVNNLPNYIKKDIKIIATALLQAKKPLIISGSHSGSTALIKAAANIAFSLKINNTKVGISYIVAESNSLGVALMNAKPLDTAINYILSGEVDTAIIMENDLYRHGHIDDINSALKKLNKLIVIDHLSTNIMKKADIILPAANFVESTGTLINNEGRIQRYFKVFDPTYYQSNITINESWRWLHSLKSELENSEINWFKLDHVIQSCVNSMPQFSSIIDAGPNALFRVKGQKIARSPQAYSGRTSILSNISVSEPGQPYDIDTPFSFSMEGNNNFNSTSKQIPFAWYPGWNSSQSWNKFQDEVGGNLRYGNPGIRIFNSINNNLNYFTDIPIDWKQKNNNEWVIAPYYHLFGSDETSQRSNAIQKRMPKTYIILNIQDAKNLSACNGTIIKFNYRNQIYQLPVIISNYLVQGQIGLPLGMPNISPTMLGMTVKNLQRII